jgi:hypothetical protein
LIDFRERAPWSNRHPDGPLTTPAHTERELPRQPERSKPPHRASRPRDGVPRPGHPWPSALRD